MLSGQQINWPRRRLCAPGAAWAPAGAALLAGSPEHLSGRRCAQVRSGAPAKGLPLRTIGSSQLEADPSAGSASTNTRSLGAEAAEVCSTNRNRTEKSPISVTHLSPHGRRHGSRALNKFPWLQGSGGRGRSSAAEGAGLGRADADFDNNVRERSSVLMLMVDEQRQQCPPECLPSPATATAFVCRRNDCHSLVCSQ